MEQNDLINLVTKQLKAEILTNRKLLAELVKDIPVTIDNNTILQIASAMNVTLPAPQPKSNAPLVTTTVSGKQALKPIAIDPGGIASKAISDLLEGNNVYFMGKAGTGKTYLAEAIPAVMGQEYFMINCSQWTSPIEIKGGQTIEGYVEGQLIKAWKRGGILILDELPKLDPNTAGLLNDALAKSAAQPKYDAKGKIDPDTIPTITNGRGDVIKKGQEQPDENLKFRFAVIATGNTNMMDVGNKYAGNQRQDYSLVDRFAGSIYRLDENELTEKRMIYPYVFDVCSILRRYLNDKDALQSVSLRTMLNFNRTYEQEMLSKIRSPFADEIFGNGGKKVPPKSVQDSIDSFMDMLEPNMRKELRDNDPVNAYSPKYTAAVSAVPDTTRFKLEFKLRYHLDPEKAIDQAPMTQAEIDALNVEARKINSDLTFLGS
jgi:cobaltochelatase CobS